MFEFIQVTCGMLEAQCRSRTEALAMAGLTEYLDALLPEEFVSTFAEKAVQTPDWIGFWVLTEGKVIGSGGFKSAPVHGQVEIGYGIHEDFWGQGAATALCQKLVSHAFEHEASLVRAHTLLDSFASQRVLQKNGFKYVGDFVEPEDGLVMRFERVNQG